MAANTSETLVNFYQTTRRYNSEDSHLHTRRRYLLVYYTLTENASRRWIKYIKTNELNAVIPTQQLLTLQEDNNYLHGAESFLRS
jgi:hypothetical protein